MLKWLVHPLMPLLVDRQAVACPEEASSELLEDYQAAYQVVVVVGAALIPG